MKIVLIIFLGCVLLSVLLVLLTGRRARQIKEDTAYRPDPMYTEPDIQDPEPDIDIHKNQVYDDAVIF